MLLELRNDPTESFGQMRALTLTTKDESLVVPQRRGNLKLGF